MADQTKQQKRVKLGRALPRDEAALDRLAEITDADIDAALAEATEPMRALVEATPDEEHEL